MQHLYELHQLTGVMPLCYFWKLHGLKPLPPLCKRTKSTFDVLHHIGTSSVRSHFTFYPAFLVRMLLQHTKRQVKRAYIV